MPERAAGRLAAVFSTRALMSGSALFMLALGVVCSFFPQEILARFGAEVGAFPVVAVKLVGGLYIGFSAINWMARGNAIGGIYSRPVTVGNFAHFLMSTIVFAKAIPGSAHAVEIAAITGINGLCLAGFVYLLFGSGRSCA